MEENGVSRPETVKQLRSALKNLGWTVAQVVDRAKQADSDISESTIRRILNDEVPPDKNFRPDGIKIISEIIYGGNSADDFDAKKARVYYDECRELRMSMNELKIMLADRNARLEHYRDLVAEERSNCQYFKDLIDYFKTRLDYISPKKEDLYGQNQ